MKKDLRFAFAGLLSCAVFLAVSLSGCASEVSETLSYAAAAASHPDLVPVAVPAPIKVGVYTDTGASGIGAFEWVRVINDSPELEITLLTGAEIRSGALQGLDVLVMPGGNSRNEFKSLGEEGAAKLRGFIHDGGCYFGTCAGACLLMDAPGRVGVIPWDTKGAENVTIMQKVEVNEKGAAALGIASGTHAMRYHAGPFMWPTTNRIDGANFELWGTYASEASAKGAVNKNKKMLGAAAIIGGTYGEGRVVAIATHPEYFNSTLYIVSGVFSYLTGRKVTFPPRRRNPGAISVAFLAVNTIPEKSAEILLALDGEKNFDVAVVNGDSLGQRALDHADVVVASASALSSYKKLANAVADFEKRGGKKVVYGAAGKPVSPEFIVGEIHKMFAE